MSVKHSKVLVIGSGLTTSEMQIVILNEVKDLRCA